MYWGLCNYMDYTNETMLCGMFCNPRLEICELLHGCMPTLVGICSAPDQPVAASDLPAGCFRTPAGPATHMHEVIRESMKPAPLPWTRFVVKSEGVSTMFLNR